MSSIDSHISILREAKTQLIIAVDGFSSCGKSTLSKDLSEILNYTFIDTGAMYRAVSLYFLDNGITIDKEKDYSRLLNDNIKIEFFFKQNLHHTFLNGKDVTHQIRTPDVANIVSDVAVNSSVRKFLVDQQRILGKKKGVIMDGRDIGTVVFPNADVKFFVTADVNIRAQRRNKELEEKRITITLDKVKENLRNRDHQDSTRSDSPLRKADDAILIDTSHHTRKTQVEEALEHIISKVSA